MRETERRLEMWKVAEQNKAMTLRADDQGRITCPELFTPNRTFEAERKPDGVITVIERGVEDVPVVHPVQTPEGWLMLPVKIDREKIRAAIRADRDSQ
jgi:hypothetical protein